MKVSAIGFGAWAIGGSWGEVDDEQSMRALHAAIDSGVNFIDTADVYGDGRSERLVARLRRERPRETIWVATKAGRRLPAQTLRRLLARESDRVGRAQPPEPRDGRHRSAAAPLSADGSPPAAGGVRHPRRPGAGGEAPLLRRQRRDGGGSAGLDAPSRGPEPADHLQHVQAQARGAGAARGPGQAGRHPRARAARERAPHRKAARRHGVSPRTITGHFNRDGQSFSKGETLSGVPYDAGLAAVERLRPLVPPGRRWRSSRSGGS